MEINRLALPAVGSDPADPLLGDVSRASAAEASSAAAGIGFCSVCGREPIMMDAPSLGRLGNCCTETLLVLDGDSVA